MNASLKVSYLLGQEIPLHDESVSMYPVPQRNTHNSPRDVELSGRVQIAAGKGLKSAMAEI